MTRLRPSILMIAAGIVLTVLAGAAGPAAADCVDYHAYLHRGHLATYPDLFLFDAAMAGDVLVAAASGTGVVSLAMPDGQPGDVLDVLPTPQYPRELVAAGDLVFAATHDGLVSVARIDAAGQLTQLASLPIDGWIRDLAVADPALLLAAGNAGLTIIDVSDPTAPAVTDVRPCGLAQEVEASGVIAYVARRGAGVRIFDLSDPHAPFFLADVDIPGSTFWLDLDGDRLAVTSDDVGLFIVDVAAPWDPVVLDALDVDPEPLILDGDRVYGIWDGTFAVVALDSAAGGEVIGRLEIEYAEEAMIPVDQGMLLLGHNYVETIDLSEPTSYEPEAIPLGFRVVDLKVTADRLVTLDAFGRLSVYRRDDTLAPELLGEVFIADEVAEVVVAGDWAFVGDDGSEAGLSGVDLSDPTEPVVAWVMPLSRLHRNLALDDDLLVVLCAADEGLHVVDVSDPAAPIPRGAMAYGGYDVALRGDVAYVAANLSGLGVVDLADPDDPQLVGTVETAGLPRSVGIADDVMVTVDYNFGISTLSLADPSWPVFLGSANAPRGGEGEVVVGERFAYIASWSMGFLVYDLIDVAAPVLLGGVHGTESGLATDGVRLFATTWDDGLLVFPPQCGEATAVDPGPGNAVGGPSLDVRVAPNPCNPVAHVRLRLGEAGRVRARVFDLRGRRIATLTDGWREAGEHRLRWDGRDHTGRTVAAGTYLVRIEAGPAARTARVSVVR
ncbi:hypothetical protein GF314_07735 [bacterium]|nr:hypothetical protein [bacterium]